MSSLSRQVSKVWWSPFAGQRNMAAASKLAGCLLAFGLIGLLPTASTGNAVAAPLSQVQQEPTLRDRLVFGLRARHPSEITFLEQLAAQVQAGNVPQRLVDETFFWVRTHKADNPFPFIYFERIIRLQANRANIAIQPTPARFGNLLRARLAASKKLLEASTRNTSAQHSGRENDATGNATVTRNAASRSAAGNGQPAITLGAATASSPLVNGQRSPLFQA